MVGFVAAIVFAGMHQGADVRIRYENPGASAKAVLADLSRQSGVLLQTARETAGEVLCVRCQDDPLSEVMKRIAWAVDGEWRAEDSGFRLIRTSETVRAEEARELALSTAKYAAELKRIRDQIAKEEAFDAEAASKLAREIGAQAKSVTPNNWSSKTWQNMAALRNRGPMVRAVAKLATLLDPVDLAKMPEQSVAVYSTKPTPTQLPLNDDAIEAVRQFLKEQDSWTQAAVREDLDPAGEQGYRFAYGVPALSGERIDESKVGYVLVKFKKMARGNNYDQVELMVADQKGKILVGESQPLQSLLPTPPASMPSGTTPPPAASVATPPEVRVVMNALRWDAHAPAPAHVREQLLNPEQVDPLGLTTGRLLLAAGQAKGQTVVADLDDAQLWTYETGAKFVPDRLLGELTSSESERNPATDWIGLRPKMPAAMREVRADRSALGMMLRTYAERMGLSLEEQAAFAVTLPDAQSNSMPQMLQQGVERNASIGRTDQRVLRMYGMLDPLQQDAAKHGGVRLDSISQRALDEISRLVYSPYPQGLNYQSASGRSNPEIQQSFYSGIFREPTECLPNGIPATGVLRIQDSANEVVGWPETHYGAPVVGNRTMHASELAWQKFAQSHASLFPWMSQPQQRVSLDKLVYGTETHYQVTLQFTPEIWSALSLDATDFGDGRTVSADQLPQEFRDQVDKQFTQYADAYKSFLPGQFVAPGQQVNPPP